MLLLLDWPSTRLRKYSIPTESFEVLLPNLYIKNSTKSESIRLTSLAIPQTSNSCEKNHNACLKCMWAYWPKNCSSQYCLCLKRLIFYVVVVVDLYKKLRFHVSHKIKFQDLNPTQPPKMKITKRIRSEWWW